jgi:hypothetical protein
MSSSEVHRVDAVQLWMKLVLVITQLSPLIVWLKVSRDRYLKINICQSTHCRNGFMLTLRALLPSDTYDYHDPKFIQIIENHLTYLRSSTAIKILTVDGFIREKYKGDYYSLLNHLLVEPKYHYIVMRFNGYTSSSDYRGTEDKVLMPDFNQIESLMSVYLTQEV